MSLTLPLSLIPKEEPQWLTSPFKYMCKPTASGANLISHPVSSLPIFWKDPKARSIYNARLHVTDAVNAALCWEKSGRLHYVNGQVQELTCHLSRAMRVPVTSPPSYRCLANALHLKIELRKMGTFHCWCLMFIIHSSLSSQTSSSSVWDTHKMAHQLIKYLSKWKGGGLV